MTQILEPFAKAAPGFNHKVAKKVYDTIMACPDDESAAFMTRAIVFDAMNRDIVRHQDFLAEHQAQELSKRAEEIKKALAKKYAEAKRTGADTSELAKAAYYIEEVSKAYNTYDRRNNARRRHRDARGRFAVESHKFDYTSRAAPLDPNVFTKLYGLKPEDHPVKNPAGKRDLSPTEIRQWQHAYAETRQLLESYGNDAKAHIRFSNGAERTADLNNLHDKLTISRTMKPAHVTVTMPVVANQPNFALMGAGIGAPAAGAAVQRSVMTQGQWNGSALNPATLRQYSNDRDAFAPEAPYAYQPGARLFNRLAAGSNLVSNTLGENAGPKTQAALEAGQWIGEFGPEAQRVLGPTAQRTAYRYRGVEKKPDRQVLGAAARARQLVQRSRNDGLRIDTYEERPTTRAGRAYNDKVAPKINRGISRAKWKAYSTERGHKQIVAVGSRIPNDTRINEKHFNVEAQTRMMIAPHVNEHGEEVASPLISYFKERLPQANLNTLHTKAGVVPPSEGIILDKNGNVITQAVGYGDDWYLPFNLKNVSRMRGGTYIRTRTFGGPTTEDVYTALMAGARQLTVVSNNGVYTMEFDKSFRGGRRYNDKAARMVNRYGQLLDAVNSGQVTLDMMDPSRRVELREQAARNVSNPDDATAIRNEFNRLVAAEPLHPQLSQRQKDQVKKDVVDQYLERVSTGTGEMATRGMVADRAVLDLRRQQGDAANTPEGRQQQDALRERLSTDDGLIAHLKLEDQVRRQSDQKLRQVRRELSPLSLNGQGYAIAMKGLQEQFPYYLQEPEYHEWEDPADRTDSGYVKPRHLRPHSALVGYFGDGLPDKVHADSLIHSEVSRYIPPTGVRQEATTSTTTSGSSGGASGAGTSATNPRAKAMADLDMAKEIARWAREGEVASGAAAGAGQRVSEAMPYILDSSHKDADANSRKISNIAGKTDEELERMQETAPEQFSRDVADALSQIRRLRLAKFNEDVVRRYEAKGQEAPLKQWPENPSFEIRKPLDTEYKFGPGFEPGGNHSRVDLLNRFRDDDDIKSTGLPDPTDPSFDTQSRELKRRLDMQYGESTALRTKHNYPPQKLNEMNRQAKGLFKAQHIKRRLEDVARDEPKAAPEEPPIREIHNIDTVITTPEGAMQAAQEAAARAGGTNVLPPAAPLAIESGDGPGGMSWDAWAQMAAGPQRAQATNLLAAHVNFMSDKEKQAAFDEARKAEKRRLGGQP